jgi:hypothetical protein
MWAAISARAAPEPRTASGGPYRYIPAARTANTLVFENGAPTQSQWNLPVWHSFALEVVEGGN